MKFLQRFTKNINIATADRATYRYLSIYNNDVEELSYADARRDFKQKLVFLVPNCSTDFEFILSDFEIEDSDRIISLHLNTKITLLSNGANNEKLKDLLTNIRTKYENELAWSSNFVFSQIFKSSEAKLKAIFSPLVDGIESLNAKNLPLNEEIKCEVEHLFLPFGKVELLDIKVLFRKPSDKLPSLEGTKDTEVFEEKSKSLKGIFNLFALLIFFAGLGYFGFEYYKNLEFDKTAPVAIEEEKPEEIIAPVEIAKPKEISDPVQELSPKIEEKLEEVQVPVLELNEYSLDFYLKSYMNFSDLKNALKSMDFVDYVSGEEVLGGFGSIQARFKIKSAFDKNTLKEALFNAFSLENKSLKKSDIKLKQ